MSVLIKGMKIPKSCNECQLTTQYYDGGMDVCCPLDKYVLPSGSKRDDCPLVEFSTLQGKWTDVSEKVWVSEIGFESAWACSNCHTIFPFYSNYCPNCGANMEEDDE